MFEWLFGGAFVALHACARYCTPFANRYSTTFFQFYFFLVFYVVSLILIYGFVGWVLHSNPELLPAILRYLTLFDVPIPADVSDAVTKGLTVPILLALLLTTLLPSIPKLKAFDAWLRAHFWRLGNIPEEAERLAAGMAFMPYRFSASTIAAIEAEADAQGVPRDRLCYDYRQDASYGWPFATALYLVLKGWKDDSRGKYARFARDNPEPFAEVERIYRQCSASAKAYLQPPASAVDGEQDAHHRAELDRARDALFHATYDELVVKAIGLIARCVLFAEPSAKERTERLDSLGFGESQSASRMIGPDKYAGIFGIVIFSLVGVAIAEAIARTVIDAGSNAVRPPLTMGTLFFTALLTASVFASAVLAVDAAKSLLRKRHAIVLKRLSPVRVAVTAGLVAALFGLAVALGLRTLKYVIGGASSIHPKQLSNCNLDSAATDWLGIRVAWCDMEWSSPYLLQSAAVAMAIAYLATRWSDHGLSRRRALSQLFDGLVAAGVLALTSIVVYFLLEGIKIDDTVVLKGTRDKASGDPLLLFMVKGALIGFVIGILVPTWHRESHRSNALQRIRAMLSDPESARALTDECDRIRNDNGLRQAFAAASAMIVLAENRPNGKEMEVLNQFWQMFGRRSFARFRGVELRDDFESYCRNLGLRLAQLGKSACHGPNDGTGAHTAEILQCLGGEIAKIEIVRGYDTVTRLLTTLCVAVAEADADVSSSELAVLDEILSRLNLTRQQAGIHAS